MERADMMPHRSSNRQMNVMGLLVAFALAVGWVAPKPALAGHKMRSSSSTCYDCHAVGGAADIVIAQTRLLKKDARSLEFLNQGWQTGLPVPCLFCHDSTDKSIRTNMVGVKNAFSTYSLSKHSVSLTSNIYGTSGL